MNQRGAEFFHIFQHGGGGHTGRKWSENSHRGEKCDYSKMNFCQLYVIVDHF